MSDPVAKKIAPVMIGIAMTVVLLAFLAYISNQRRKHVTLPPPELELITPASSATVDSPLTLHFRSTEAIKLRPNGWGVRNLHLHARINGVEYMPAAADIRATDSAFVWVVPNVGRGQLAVQIGWADHAHRELTSGMSDVAHVTLR